MGVCSGGGNRYPFPAVPGCWLSLRAAGLRALLSVERLPTVLAKAGI